MSRAALLAAVLLLTSCGASTQSSGGPASNPPSSADTARSTAASPAVAEEADPDPPPRRACYRLSIKKALAPTNASRPRPCRDDGDQGTTNRRKLTSMTFYVGSLRTFAEGHLMAVDSAAVQRQVSTVCPSRLPKFLGGSVESLRLSVFRAVWFTPTLAESDSGADWFRCDVVALATPGRLAPLTGDIRGVLNGDFAAAYGLCGTARPDAPGFRRVSCAQAHTWRALRSVDIPGRDYPGARAVQAEGVTPCTEAAREEAQDTLDFQWGYEWPSRRQWTGFKRGLAQRYGVCWAPADGS
jgi:Septum formation